MNSEKQQHFEAFQCYGAALQTGKGDALQETVIPLSTRIGEGSRQKQLKRRRREIYLTCRKGNGLENKAVIPLSGIMADSCCCRLTVSYPTGIKRSPRISGSRKT